VAGHCGVKDLEILRASVSSVHLVDTSDRDVVIAKKQTRKKKLKRADVKIKVATAVTHYLPRTQFRRRGDLH
jgi:hypothetical protein